MVTTSRESQGVWEEEARTVASAVGGVWMPREHRHLDDLRAYGDPVVVMGQQGMRVHTRGGELYYHPGMGRPRIRQLQAGKSDTMVAAMDLRAGDCVLDCTLGLGSDAIVAAHAVGPSGRVVGWESVPLLAELVRRGMRTYEDDVSAVTAAMSRVEVVCRDHRQGLPRLDDRSFDVVYFDPMFQEPVYESSHFTPLRTVTDPQSLDVASVQEARRVARRRVVIKERRDSSLFGKLRTSRIVGGRRSRIAYGILDALTVGGN